MVIIKIKEMKILSIFAAFAIVSIAWGGKLKLPLEGGHFVSSRPVMLAHNANILFLIPDKNLGVKAAQACLIKSVLMSDAIYSIVTAGKYNITYSGLKKAIVKKGDKVRQGQIIGSLGEVKDSIEKPMLELYIQKHDKPIIDTTIFDNTK